MQHWEGYSRGSEYCSISVAIALSCSKCHNTVVWAERTGGGPWLYPTCLSLSHCGVYHNFMQGTLVLGAGRYSSSEVSLKCIGQPEVYRG